ncbi:MAG: glycoside hydrolase family 3 [Chlorobiaceae bacterium]|nr:glycoside hydrolase family 3 [Chlorobiaceae bacterium]NTV16406.1 glycoside hydrolase family 3 [Chlorobiaceae bacterium]
MKKTSLAAATLLFLFFCSMPASGTTQPDSISIKIGQMLMIGFRGLSIADAPQIAADIRERHIGGVVLFDYDVPSHSPSRNISSPQQLSLLTQELQEATQIPLLIAIDQEGGKVNRLKPARGFPPSVSAQHLGMLNNPDSTRAAALQCARTLKAMHIGMNLGPVADLNTNPDNPVIGRLGRSFSSDPAVVISNIKVTCSSYRNEGIIPTLKHFPGHGSSTTDTHRDFTDISGTWSENELEPYRALIASGYHDPIMTAHVFNGKLDPLYPATLSKAILDGMLRGKLGFKGVIVSDDMQMKAIADLYGLETAIRLAIEAGVDILLFGNNTTYDPDIALKATEIIRSLLQKKIITEKRIDRAYQRIMDLKERYLFKCK